MKKYAFFNTHFHAFFKTHFTTLDTYLAFVANLSDVGQLFLPIEGA